MTDSASSQPIPTDDELKESWPSIPLAYEFVRPSYDLMLKRFEVMEGRARGLLAIVATVIFGVPAFAKAILVNADFSAPTFYGAVAAAIMAATIGLWAQSSGKIAVYSPREIYDHVLHLGEWQFKWTAIYSAAEAFDVNERRVASKGRAMTTMTALLVLQIVLLIAWVILQA